MTWLDKCEYLKNLYETGVILDAENIDGRFLEAIQIMLSLNCEDRLIETIVQTNALSGVVWEDFDKEKIESPLIPLLDQVNNNSIISTTDFSLFFDRNP